MFDTELRRKVAWLIFVRAVISTILLGSATFAQIKAPGSFAVDPFFFLIGLTFALTVAYAVTLPLVDRWRWLVDVQLAGDALIVSAFISFTGGIASYFTTLYVLPIVAGSSVQFRRGGLLVAAFSTVLYVLLVLAQYSAVSGHMSSAWLTHYITALPARTAASYTVTQNVVSFLAVALLSGSLADRLRTADAQLEQASTEIADLQALNQHVIDSLPSGLATTDSSLRIQTFNRAAETITGLPHGSVAGHTLDEVLQWPTPVRESIQHDLDAKTSGATSSAIAPPTAAVISKSGSRRRTSRRPAGASACCSRSRT